MAKRMLAIVLPMLLAGCDGGSGSCSVAQVADLPLIRGLRIPTVQATLNGQSVAALIDTGAGTSIVTPTAVDRFGLPLNKDNRMVMLSGIGGSSFVPLATIHRLELGHGRAQDLELPVGSALPPTIQGIPVLGLFGADFMANYDVDIDVPHHHFALYHLRSCDGPIAPLDQPSFQVPFQLQGTAVMVDLRLNGTPITAQLDSGASATAITDVDARRAGVHPDPAGADRTLHLSGVDTNTLNAHVARFGSLQIGNERMNNFPFAIAALNNGSSLLGDEFFHFNRVWISYSHKLLFIQPAFENHMVHGDAPIQAASAGH